MYKMPESDWKYMRKIEKELLNELCTRINKRAMIILEDQNSTEHEKYLSLYKHTVDSDKTVARCFNDWSRSTLLPRLYSINTNDLLTEEHLQNLSEKTRDLLKNLQKEGN